MRILVLGATGMLGHAACRVLRPEHRVFGTCRESYRDRPRLSAFLPAESCIERFVAGAPGSLERAFDVARPDVVLNCIGIVKQKHEASRALPALRINALFPHELAEFADRSGAKVIHVSTDCVFSGRTGGIDESGVPDPVDLYGRSKLLGEVTYPPHLTIRTSLIGRELATSTGLLEWLLTNRNGKVRGYTRAIFSGLTTRTLVRVLMQALTTKPGLTGLYHVASEPVSKYQLLMQVNEALGLGIEIERDERFQCDRSLDGRRFVTDTGVRIPGWPEMIDDLRSELSEYEFDA
jgi:dTDP-4-dehydrorhamnose reductase